MHLMKTNMPVVLSMLSPELHPHSSVSKLQSGNLTPGSAVVVVAWSTLQPIGGEQLGWTNHSPPGRLGLGGALVLPGKHQEVVHGDEAGVHPRLPGRGDNYVPARDVHLQIRGYGYVCRYGYRYVDMVTDNYRVSKKCTFVEKRP